MNTPPVSSSPLQGVPENQQLDLTNRSIKEELSPNELAIIWTQIASRMNQQLSARVNALATEERLTSEILESYAQSWIALPSGKHGKFYENPVQMYSELVPGIPLIKNVVMEISTHIDDGKCPSDMSLEGYIYKNLAEADKGQPTKYYIISLDGWKYRVIRLKAIDLPKSLSGYDISTGIVGINPNINWHNFIQFIYENVDAIDKVIKRSYYWRKNPLSTSKMWDIYRRIAELRSIWNDVWRFNTVTIKRCKDSIDKIRKWELLSMFSEDELENMERALNAQQWDIIERQKRNTKATSSYKKIIYATTHINEIATRVNWLLPWDAEDDGISSWLSKDRRFLLSQQWKTSWDLVSKLIKQIDVLLSQSKVSGNDLVKTISEYEWPDYD